MHRKLITLLILFCFVLSGCVLGNSGGESDGVVVYRLDGATGGSLVRENIKLSEDSESVESIVAGLNSRPADTHLFSAFPDGVQIENLSLKNGVAIVKMSPEYALLSERERLLADAAIVLSLSTADEICYVDISCGSKVYAARLSVESYAEADGICGEFERTIKLYLPDESGFGLVPRSVDTVENSSEDMVSRVLQELFKALEGMEDTPILSVVEENGVCRVDLGEEFYGAEPADSGEGMEIIFSIVNSLCRIPGVESIVISVEGLEVVSYGGFRTQWPVASNMGLVKN